MEWDWIGLDELGLIGIFCAWSRKDGVEFGLKVSSDGWDGAGDSYSWITNMQWLLLMIRIV